jgi:hypothetical protein
LQSRYHSHAVIWTDLTVDATHAGISHDQIVSLTFETLIRHCSKETNHPSASSLFLLGVGLLSLGLGTLLTDTDEAGLRAGVTELTVCVLLTLVVADGALLESDDVLDGQSSGCAGNDVLSSLGRLDVLSRGVTLLGLSVAAGEENEALPVLLEALDVGLEAFLGQVLAAGVDRDTDGAGELAGDTGGCNIVSGVQRSSDGGMYPSTQRERNHGRHERGGCLHSKLTIVPTTIPSIHIHLTVGHRTTGRRRSTGRGATLAAFATRALRLDFFLPGYGGRKHLYTGATTLKEVRGELPGRSARGRSVACRIVSILMHGKVLMSHTSPCGSGSSGSAGCA